MTIEKKPFHIAHVSTPLSWRGGEQQLFYLYQYLKKQGVEQQVFCPVGSVLSNKVDDDETIQFIKHSGFDLRAAKKIASDCKKRNIQVIHAHDAHAHTFCILATDLFGMNIPIVLSRRVDFPISKAFFSKYKYNHLAIKAISCVSDAIAEIIRSGLKPANREKVVTIHSGIDPTKFTGKRTNVLRNELNIADDKILVGNVAALADHKDYPTFLKTVSHLKSDERLEFVVVGDGPLREDIHQLCASLDLLDRVHFTGYRNDLEQCFADLDILLFTSKTEGLGTTILDAFANKVAVVATRAGGIPEMVEDGKTGILCEVGDDEGLAEGVRRVVNDQSLKTQITVGGSNKLSEFTSDQMAIKTLNLYRKILTSV